MIFFTILSIGLVLLSFKENWPDLRFTSFAILAPVLLYYSGRFAESEMKIIPLGFLISIFVLYHIAALINSLKDPKESLPVLDSIIIIGFNILFLFILYSMFEWPKIAFGLFVMVFGPYAALSGSIRAY